MKNNVLYPIKYGLLEIPNSTFGYVVSKCYVVEDTVKYYPNGSRQEYHKVVFPYPSIGNYLLKMRYDAETKSLGIRNYPKYDMFNNICNTSVVRELFDSYEEAYVYATVKNQNLINELYEKIPFKHTDDIKLKDEERERLSSRFQTDLETCERFERLILENTTDMIVDGEEERPLDLDKLEGQKQLIRICINSKRGF